jgi:hypothetical protein
MNDTVQSPAMQQWPCSSATWPSCGSGCVQDQACIECFQKAGTWSDTSPSVDLLGFVGRLPIDLLFVPLPSHLFDLELAYFAADCPSECYPEGLIANRAIDVLDWHVNNPSQPFFFGCEYLDVWVKASCQSIP